MNQDWCNGALTKARIFGAAFIYVGVDDGQAQETPLLLEKVRGVRFLNVLTKASFANAERGLLELTK